MVDLCGIKMKVLVVLLLATGWLQGQIITSGEITFERRTNLEKRFEGDKQMSARDKKWMKEPKIDRFTLYFNEKSSLFLPIANSLADEDREWATMKNTSYQNFETGMIEREFSVYGSSIFFVDTIKERTWVLTGNTRNIAGYSTKQVLWEANDSTRIYAWYTDQIVPSVGPESFSGLPGAILGLAIEDGGVIYFASEVKPLSLPDFEKKKPKFKDKSAVHGEEELDAFIKKTLSGGMRGSLGRMLEDFFIW